MQQRQPLGVASAEEEIPQEPVASSLNSTAGAAGPVPAAQHKSAVGNEPRWGRAAVVLSAESSLQQEEEEFLAAQRGAESSPSPSRGSMAAQPTGGERPSEERSPTPGISPVSPSVVSPGKGTSQIIPTCCSQCPDGGGGTAAFFLRSWAIQWLAAALNQSDSPGMTPPDAETSLDMQAVAELPVLPRSTASRDPGTRGGSPLDQGRASPDHAGSIAAG